MRGSRHHCRPPVVADLLAHLVGRGLQPAEFQQVLSVVVQVVCSAKVRGPASSAGHPRSSRVRNNKESRGQR